MRGTKGKMGGAEMPLVVNGLLPSAKVFLVWAGDNSCGSLSKRLKVIITMAEPNESEVGKRRSTGDEGGSSPKRPRTDPEPEQDDDDPLDPGKKAYLGLKLILRTITGLLSKPERGADVIQRLRTQVKKLEDLFSRPAAVDEGEVPHPLKLIQIYLKHTLLNSEKIKEEDNVKNFLSGLEDCSASKSDKNDSVFVFLANYATELWYQWEEEEKQWKWTPDWEFWMPCSSTVVSGGQWKGETPAPENVEIIGYLDTVRPVPTDEQYLPSFDIVDVFGELGTLNDPHITGSLKKVIQALRNQEVETKSEHMKTLMKALADIEEKLQDSFDQNQYTS